MRSIESSVKYEVARSDILFVYVRLARSRPFLVACALLVVGGLFAPWTTAADGEFVVLFGALDKLPDPERSGWEELAWLDVALVAVAVVVVAAAFVRAARVPAALLAAAGAIGVAVAGFGDREPVVLLPDSGQGRIETDPVLLGPALCLAGLTLAAAALLLRSRSTDS